jgi:hypothetical protein
LVCRLLRRPAAICHDGSVLNVRFNDFMLLNCQLTSVTKAMGGDYTVGQVIEAARRKAFSHDTEKKMTVHLHPPYPRRDFVEARSGEYGASR